MSFRVMATLSVSLVTLEGIVVVYVAREFPPGKKKAADGDFNESLPLLCSSSAFSNLEELDACHVLKKAVKSEEE